MSQFYELVAFGTSPVSLADMKLYLKRSTTAEDALIQAMIDAATEWGEKYTGREFRANQWKLLIDCFTDRIEVRRSPVDTIDTVEHLVGGSLVTVSADTYFLKKGNFTSEILLNVDKAWPTNTDEREQAIEIAFTTKQHPCGDLIVNAIKEHVTFLFFNRGDCDDAGESALSSGAVNLYNLIKIPRT